MKSKQQLVVSYSILIGIIKFVAEYFINCFFLFFILTCEFGSVSNYIMRGIGNLSYFYTSKRLEWVGVEWRKCK